MSSLVVVCRRCAKEVPTNAIDKSGLCVICIIADVVIPLKAEYGRLWAKRLRYSRRGIQLGHVEEQLTRIARRLGDQVHARINNPKVAIPLINAHLEEVRTKVEHPSLSRIHLPQMGDMLKRKLAIA